MSPGRLPVSVTLDASVWLAAISPSEPSHSECERLLDCLVAQESTLHQPGLFVIEVCATTARRTRDAALAERMGRLAISLPGLQLHELDHSLAARASLLAAQCALRGADAVYVATAQQAAATLLTLDRELIERGAAAAEVLSPAQWMARVAP